MTGLFFFFFPNIHIDPVFYVLIRSSFMICTSSSSSSSFLLRHQIGGWRSPHLDSGPLCSALSSLSAVWNARSIRIIEFGQPEMKPTSSQSHSHVTGTAETRWGFVPRQEHAAFPWRPVPACWAPTRFQTWLSSWSLRLKELTWMFKKLNELIVSFIWISLIEQHISSESGFSTHTSCRRLQIGTRMISFHIFGEVILIAQSRCLLAFAWIKDERSQAGWSNTLTNLDVWYPFSDAYAPSQTPVEQLCMTIYPKNYRKQCVQPSVYSLPQHRSVLASC